MPIKHILPSQLEYIPTSHPLLQKHPRHPNKHASVYITLDSALCHENSSKSSPVPAFRTPRRVLSFHHRHGSPAHETAASPVAKRIRGRHAIGCRKIRVLPAINHRSSDRPFHCLLPADHVNRARRTIAPIN